jgi:probable F420-dependent oxidoreductase
VKFGLFAPNIGPFAEPDGAKAAATLAEQHGFDSLWAIEHAVVPAGYESRYPYSGDGRMPAAEVMNICDPLVWLAQAAAVTDRIRLCTGIVILPQRNPVILAKQVATLDRLSGGRVTLGVGIGWLEEEFEALGVPFEGRAARTDEYIAVLRALWGDERVADGPVSFDGELCRFKDLWSRPAPIQRPVPILVGGHSPAACRRAGRLGDAFYPGCATEEDLFVAIDTMRTAARQAGRDPDAIEITAGAPFSSAAWDVDAVQRLEAQGVARVTILPPAFDIEGLGPRLDEFASTVIAALR